MSRARLTPAIIVAIAIAAFALRVVTLTGPGGASGAGTGYDDGVYFSASALFLRGFLPYRDFVFVHPPGVVYLLSLTSWLPDVQTGFAAARVLVALAGGANVALAGTLAARIGGPFAGIVAALLYAFYPDAVLAERSTYLEPFLNLGCLMSALFWLRPDGQRRPWVAGILAGAACAVKLWGGIWVLAAIASTPRGRGRDIVRFIAAAAVTGMLLLAPLFLAAPSQFIEQTLTFQLSRPPDGTPGALPRIPEILGAGHRAASVLAAIGLLAALFRRFPREERYFSLAMLLTIVAFALSSSYWVHYNSHLAASQCVMAGLGAAALLRIPRMPRVAGVIATLLIVAALDWRPMRDVVRYARLSSGEMMAARSSIAAVVPPGEEVFAFDPSWTLAASRLPPHGEGAPVIVDTYGAMLLQATRGRRKPSDTASAFANAPVNDHVRARLAMSKYVLPGWRGKWQMTAADREWFSSWFVCVNPEAGAMCVWERMSKPATGSADLETQKIEYGEGWHGEEGLPPETWRWTTSRAVMFLPPARTGGKLELRMHVPLDSLEDAPEISVEIDGRVIEKFSGTDYVIERAWDLTLPPRTTPHTLVLTTSHTFVPSRKDSASQDTRELGLRVDRVTWRRK